MSRCTYDVPMNSQIGTVRGLQFTPNDVVCDPAADRYTEHDEYSPGIYLYKMMGY